MDQELQFLINTLYGNKLNEKQLAGIMQMAQQNPQYLQNMRNAANAKMPGSKLDMSNIRANNIASQRTPTLGRTDFNHFTANKGIAKNDMSAVDDFKQAFRQARQGGNKTFFWKKTKANPSGMFSTEMASSQTASPENIPVENSQIPATSIKADMSKTDLPIFKGPRISQGLANALSPKTPEIGTNSYQFDVNAANAELRSQNKQNPHNNMSMRPYLKQGGDIQGSPIDAIINAINSATDMQTVNNIIQQSGQNPETIMKEIVSRAQKGDQAAAMAFSNLEKLMKNSTVAKLGTKLNYIQKLKGICPEGTEKIYLKNGGCMCAQKAQKGSNGIEKNDTIHHNKKVYDLTGKHKQFKKLTNKDYRNLPTKKQASVDNKDMMRAKDAEKKACGGKADKKKKK